MFFYEKIHFTYLKQDHSAAARKYVLILYSRKFSSAKNFVKSDRQAVRHEFYFRQKPVVAHLLFARSVVALLLIVYLHIHEYF